MRQNLHRDLYAFARSNFDPASVWQSRTLKVGFHPLQSEVRDCPTASASRIGTLQTHFYLLRDEWHLLPSSHHLSPSPLVKPHDWGTLAVP